MQRDFLIIKRRSRRITRRFTSRAKMFHTQKRRFCFTLHDFASVSGRFFTFCDASSLSLGMSNTVKPAWDFEPCVCHCSTSCDGKQDVLHAINPQKRTLAVACISRSADAASSSSSSMHLPWIQTQTVPDCQTCGSPVRSSQGCVLMMRGDICPSA